MQSQSFLSALSTRVIGETHNGGLCGAGAMIGCSREIGNPCSLKQTIDMNTKVIEFMDQNRSQVIVENHFMVEGGFIDVDAQIKRDYPDIKTYEGISLATCLEVPALFFEIVPPGFDSWEDFVWAASGGKYVSVTQGTKLVQHLKSDKREWWSALHFCGYAAMKEVTIEIANGDEAAGVTTSDLIRHAGCAMPESGKADATILRVCGNHFVTVLCPNTIDAVYLEKKGLKLFTARGYLEDDPFFANNNHGHNTVSKLQTLARLKSKSQQPVVASPARKMPAGSAAISPPALPAKVSCCNTYSSCCCCRLHLV